MPDAPTPGQRAYEAWWRSLNDRAELDFAHQLPATQRAWEAAAQAVLTDYLEAVARLCAQERVPPQEAPPTPEPAAPEAS